MNPIIKIVKIIILNKALKRTINVQFASFNALNATKYIKRLAKIVKICNIIKVAILYSTKKGLILIMINIGVCDDESVHRNRIKEILLDILKTFNLEYKIYEYDSGESLLENYPSNLDILIIDIQMKSINGMDTARKIRENDDDVEIIFMTSFAEFMQDGYEVRAYRYLLKPINENKIMKHITPCIKDIMRKRSNYITLNTRNYIDRVKIDSILYIETNRPNVLIYTNDNIYSIKMSMSKIEKELKDCGFFRCHASYMINLSKVESMYGNTVIVGGKDIQISKYRVKDLKLAITNILGDIIC